MPVTTMTDQEFIDQVRRGLFIIMRALIKRYGIPWSEFAPVEKWPAAHVVEVEAAQPVVTATVAGVMLDAGTKR